MECNLHFLLKYYIYYHISTRVLLNMRRMFIYIFPMFVVNCNYNMIIFSMFWPSANPLINCIVGKWFVRCYRGLKWKHFFWVKHKTKITKIIVLTKTMNVGWGNSYRKNRLILDKAGVRNWTTTIRLQLYNYVIFLGAKEDYNFIKFWLIASPILDPTVCQSTKGWELNGSFSLGIICEFCYFLRS